MKPRLIVIVLVADVALTLLAANLVGPAASKFARMGLPGLLMRTPFYLLRLYIGPAILLLPRVRPWYLTGPIIGLTFCIPLAFWSRLPSCPPSEPWINLALGALQGLTLAWLADHLGRTSILSRLRLSF